MATALEADARSIYDVETSDVLNTIEFCQPCNEQDNENPAVYWCTNCLELLCDNCHRYHKVLKATRNHKLICIDDYHMIGTSIAECESRCQTHPARLVLFVCVTHNIPCCTSCKVEKHGTGCDVQFKEDILKIVNTRGDMNTTIEAMKKIIENMRSDLLNDHWNASDLEKQKSHYYDEMKNARQRVERFLDEFEKDARGKFESAFCVTHGAIRDNKRKIEHRLNVLQTRAETAERIKESVFSDLQMYLINNKFCQDNSKDKLLIESLCEETRQFCIAATPVYDLNKETKQIILSNGFEEKVLDHSRKCEKETEVDAIEISSSTVEAEEYFVIQDNSSNDKDTTESILPVVYKLNEHFLIERRNVDIFIRCARFLQNNKIVMTENSGSRLLVYRTTGFKIGQVKFEEGPNEIAVIKENRVAVSTEKKIIFVDLDNMHIEKQKFLSDTITGLSFANDKLFACLHHSGIHILDLSGNISRTIPFIKGSLYICSTIDDMIYSVATTKFKTLQCYDVNKREKDEYSLTCSSDANGISCDKNGNIFIAGSDSEIFRFNPTSKTFLSILTEADGINNPLNVDCSDSGSKILVIDKRNELKIFKIEN
ncbi:Hypothetical predicted protein [Mytilus galloprovincialis]|uniref:B box-type domain-containing protein n=1 Tax=Mytilus galloprovincialis TaxID=29158 RepID=A0A8B6CPR3_MYTGA|nr:Hypothetical predicted protein [Mytilus galloprovincialis]